MSRKSFYAGAYTLWTTVDGQTIEAPSNVDMWINQDHIVRCMLNGNQRSLVMSNGDRITYTEDEPF